MSNKYKGTSILHKEMSVRSFIYMKDGKYYSRDEETDDDVKNAKNEKYLMTKVLRHSNYKDVIFIHNP